MGWFAKTIWIESEGTALGSNGSGVWTEINGGGTGSGPPGPTGATGDAGPPGDPGADGVLDPTFGSIVAQFK